ncbi:MAG: hypothetical protein ABEI27_02210 [Halobellus sp.]
MVPTKALIDARCDPSTAVTDSDCASAAERLLALERATDRLGGS